MRAASALLLLGAVVSAAPTGAAAEQASQPASVAAGHVATGRYHSCAVQVDASVRCWGYGGDGALGYGNASSVGDDETPASVGPVNIGAGRSAIAISAGTFHTCAILDDGTVRCWGYGGDGRLGYDNTISVGARQAAGSVGPVDLGGHTARAISAGGAHTCAVLDDGSVRCWGFAFDGQLGYNSKSGVGDGAGKTPASVGPVDLGGHKAKAISAGGAHTCALLDDDTVRCWGLGAYGQLGYGKTSNVGDGTGQTPASVGPVDLGGHTARAVSAGGTHTCAVLDDGSVRCWGAGGDGRLGYGNTNNVGDGTGQTPASVGAVNLGAGRTAMAISAGAAHTCALLDDKTVRCWGYGAFGQLGYANTNSVGDTPATTPDTVGPVDLGPGRSAMAISVGDLHTCALLDNASVRCWGYGLYGRLGYCNESNVGNTQTPGSVGPVNLQPGDGGAGCASTPGPPAPGAGPAAGPGGGAYPAAPPRPRARSVDPFGLQALRARGLRRCLRTAARRTRRHRVRARRDCLKHYGRTPGRVTGLHARAASGTQVVLSFTAPGSDGRHPPAAGAYLIKQSRRPIRRGRDFRRGQTLCRGYCRFAVSVVGAKITLTISHLRPHTTYYYAIAARDNVSHRTGVRSATIRIRTR